MHWNNQQQLGEDSQAIREQVALQNVEHEGEKIIVHEQLYCSESQWVVQNLDLGCMSSFHDITLFDTWTYTGIDDFFLALSANYFKYLLGDPGC